MMATVVFVITSDPAIMSIGPAEGQKRRSDTRTRLTKMREVLGGEGTKSVSREATSAPPATAPAFARKHEAGLKYVSVAYCGTDDVACFTCSPVMSMRSDVQLVDALNASRLSDRTEHMVRAVTHFMATLPDRALVVASADLIRILGRQDVLDGAMYLVRFEGGMPSVMVHLDDEVNTDDIEAMLHGDVDVRSSDRSAVV